MELSLTRCILRWLTIPADCWPSDLPWDCRQCKLRQDGASKACQHCRTGNTSKAWALANILDSISSFLSTHMPDEAALTKFYPTDTLLTILLSPHNNHMKCMLSYHQSS